MNALDTNCYRVDMLLAIGAWVEYTSRKRLLPLGMAEAYGRALQRQGQPGRIVDASTGTVVSEWSTK